MKICLCVLSFWISSTLDASAQEQFPYNLAEPSNRYDLPPDLLEVSGISCMDNDLLGMVQDELGKLYIYQTNEYKLSKVYDFTDHGDFEGVEIVGDTAYVLRSDGTIFLLANFSTNMTVHKYATFLTADNDTEGICYDAKNHHLLITCKSSPSNPLRSYKGNRAVYTFDLKKHKLNPVPIILINRNFIEEKMNDSDQKFKPSGIGIHPVSGDIYMTAASGQLLVVVDSEGEIKWIKKLKKKIFRQPEGVSFTKDGRMYICSEGKEAAGYVLSFDYSPQ